MDVIQWQQDFEIGIVEIDQQHHHLVDVTNQFGKLLSQDKIDLTELENVFNELVSYTQYHFQTEEKLMASVHIDERHCRQHHEEHIGFLQGVSTLHQEVASGQATSRDLFDFLINWLVYHILGTDRCLGLQFAAINAGSSPEIAFQKGKCHFDRATTLLLSSVDKLFSQVVQRNRQLQELNQNLEAKVEERTRELSAANRKLEIQASTDVLTGLANRRRAMELLENFWRNASLNNLPLSCMLIDADGFKEINDAYGHDAGDAVLCELAKQLRYAVRNDDFVCRLGGDEFLLICPKTNLQGALHLAHQIHSKIKDLSVQAGTGTWQGSISVGVASRTDEMQNIEGLLKAADRAVYVAKNAGKNCVRKA